MIPCMGRDQNWQIHRDRKWASGWQGLGRVGVTAKGDGHLLGVMECPGQDTGGGCTALWVNQMPPSCALPNQWLT